jgi:UDP-N-acetylmuramate--alanine ligase
MSPKTRTRTYSVKSPLGDLYASAIEQAPDSVTFKVFERDGGAHASVRLAVPGLHNVSNALAALSAARAYGLSLVDACKALEGFSGTKRRLEVVGTAAGVTVIDDFGHNPDKITATLATLHAFPGRLLIMFQPHGFGPLKLMKQQFIECFADNMDAEDVSIVLSRANTSSLVSARAACRRWRSPNAPRVATSCWSLPRPAIASSSWARATIR